MKILLTMLIVTGISIAVTAISAAANKEASKAITQDESIQEQLLQTVSYSGLVVEGQDGFMLQTEEGNFQLRGLNLQDLLHKNVVITGILKNDQDINTLFVVKVENQS